MSNRLPRAQALDMFQTAAKTFSIAVKDANEVAIDLTGKDMRMVVHDGQKPPVFKFQSEVITITGTGNDHADVIVDISMSATANAHWRWELWDITTTEGEAVLAHGAFKILPAVKGS